MIRLEKVSPKVLPGQVAGASCVRYLRLLKLNDGGWYVSTVEGNTNLDSSLRENRVFAPPAEFAAKAHIKGLAEYEAMYRRSVERPEEFWAEAAKELDWFAPWTRVTAGRRSAFKVVC